MKKEYIIVLLLILFVLSSVLDSLAGPLKISLKTPFDFLKNSYLSTYPLTTVGIASKALFITLGLSLAMSLVEGMYLGKGLVLIFVAVLAELYSIQQIATNSKVTPLEWNLGLAATGFIMLVPAILFILWGAAKNVHKKISGASEEETTSPAPPEP